MRNRTSKQNGPSPCQPSRRSRIGTKDVEKAADKLDPSRLYDIPLIPVDCKFDVIQEQPEKVQALKAVVQKERRLNGCKVTVLFAIRRPGCGNCREHGRQLTQLSSLERDVAFVGAMKHGAGVDDAALLDFYQQYYRFPLFMDSDWKIYKAMGGRKLSYFKAISSIPRLEARYKKKGIPNIPFGGDIWTQGGILIFDKMGNLRYTHYEKYGEELDLEEIRFAIHQARVPLRGEPAKRRDSIAISIDAMSGSTTSAYDYSVRCSSSGAEEATLSGAFTTSTIEGNEEEEEEEEEPPVIDHQRRCTTFASTDSRATTSENPAIEKVRSAPGSASLPARMAYAENRIAKVRRHHSMQKHAEDRITKVRRHHSMHKQRK